MLWNEEAGLAIINDAGDSSLRGRDTRQMMLHSFQ